MMRTSKAVAKSACIVALVGAALVSGWLMRSASAQADTETFRKEFLGPRPAFSQAVVVRSGHVKTIYIAGQTGAGDDLKTQMLGAYQNLVKRLGEAGAKPEDLVQTTFYIVNYKPEDFKLWQEIVANVLPAPNLPAATLVGVQSLASARLLFEIEAIAVTGQ